MAAQCFQPAAAAPPPPAGPSPLEVLAQNAEKEVAAAKAAEANLEALLHQARLRTQKALEAEADIKRERNVLRERARQRQIETQRLQRPTQHAHAASAMSAQLEVGGPEHVELEERSLPAGWFANWDDETRRMYYFRGEGNAQWTRPAIPLTCDV